ncbi:hypothetical protein EGT74_15400 [Chitinophaga lutea]|uniref:Uncharacterized protein n=2 Tax=Chitinophaga lutea TaxID=2488634 RepID=A0A3N4PIC0_9BACT|nr:hypothetical protein EGT74_15400 [Chitinophaga lutea]
MLKELEVIGYKYRDINEMFKQKIISSEAVAIILKWLPSVYADHLGAGDQLVRSLIAAGEPFDSTLLIDLIERPEFNFSIKGGMAIVLSYAKTNDISDWLRDQLLNKPYALERIGLIPGLEKKVALKHRMS